jgi:hypothetical protein
MKQNLPAMEKQFGPLRFCYQQVSLHLYTSLHGVTFHIIVNFISTAVRMWSLKPWQTVGFVTAATYVTEYVGKNIKYEPKFMAQNLQWT